MSPRVRQVLCLSGSLRRVSSNTAVLEAARQLAPPGTLKLVLYDGLGRLPLFSPDDELDPLSAPVLALREAVGCSDALLVACPEYAHGIPGAFKNLLDWLVGSLQFPGKPMALINASGRGSQHAQAALREVLVTMSARLLDQVSRTVPLPGAGCTVETILASAERCAELRAMLAALDEALDQALD